MILANTNNFYELECIEFLYHSNLKFQPIYVNLWIYLSGIYTISISDYAENIQSPCTIQASRISEPPIQVMLTCLECSQSLSKHLFVQSLPTHFSMYIHDIYPSHFAQKPQREHCSIEHVVISSYDWNWSSRTWSLVPTKVKPLVCAYAYMYARIGWIAWWGSIFFIGRGYLSPPILPCLSWV